MERFKFLKITTMILLSYQMAHGDAILLNEYNAVAPSNLLKKSGYDTYFGQIAGNGGSWIELVVVEDGYDLREDRLLITQSSTPDFIATFPNIEVLSNLKQGTIITISELPTDITYNPEEGVDADWNINLNHMDLTIEEGIFITNNLKTKVSITSKDGNIEIMSPSGEGIFGGGIDDTEVFKLKKAPSSLILPTDATAYGDDEGRTVISTFGTPNRWKNSSGIVIEQNLLVLRGGETDTSSSVLNPALLLNEYSAVAPDKQLKDDGFDTHFGQVLGNGGSWIELVVTKDYLNLQHALIKIRQNETEKFEARLPSLIELGYLRKGTIITLSNEPTDMSYAPFSRDKSDWTLNINVDALINQVGDFNVTSNEANISIFSMNLSDTLLPPSGEAISSENMVDNREVYKLKAEPELAILPTDTHYGDDNDMQSLSTFGTPNEWRDNRDNLKKQKFNIRKGQDLDEKDGIVLSAVDTFKDTESLLYIAQNNTLWIADDATHKVYEMDLETYEIKSSFDDKSLGEFTNGVIQESCHDRAGICDIESLAYDNLNDTLYIFVGNVASTPAVFQLTRENPTDQFTLNAFRELGEIEYSASQFINGQFVVAVEDKLYLYDFETNQINETLLLYTIDEGKIHGLAHFDEHLWITTSTAKLKKIEWTSDKKEEKASYDMRQNGVYDPRGIEVIDKKLYILEGINSVSKHGEPIAPLGHALKNAIHIFDNSTL